MNMNKKLLAIFSWLVGAMALTASAGSFVFTAPEGATVPVLNKACKEFLALPSDQLDARLMDAGYYERFKKAGSLPVRARFAWEYKPDAGEGKPKRFIVTVRKADTGRVIFNADALKSEITLENLEIATDYVLHVSVCGKKDVELFGADRPFRTEDLPPRVLNVKDVSNFRDLGGWIGEGGKRVKQGLVYRSKGLNDNADWFCRDKKGKKVAKPDKRDWRVGKLRGTPESRRQCRATLGIKTELDLRRSATELWGMSGSPLGSSVDWRSVQSSAYGSMDSPSVRTAFVRDFRTFLNRDNYPILFHCIGGADRTGTLAYILNGLLGVSADDLERDYHFTAACMGHPWPMTETNKPCRIEGFKKVLAKYPGATVNERIYEYVRSCGIKKSEIATFKSIMFGEDTPSSCDAYERFVGTDSAERRELMHDAKFRDALHDMDGKWNGVGVGVPRWYSEARNCRDLGGWRTKDGARIRFGRLFRSAVIDEPKVRTALVKRLGVKTDLDLRKPDEAKPTPDLPAITVQSPNYASAVTSPKWLRAVFDVLLDEAKYPIVFHCAKGADRTGTLAAVIELLLGVDEDDVAKDWQLTAVYNRNPLFLPIRYDRMMAELAKLKGNTWQEKAETWVKSAGVTDAEIEKFRSMMLEQPKIVIGLVSDTHLRSPLAAAHGKGSTNSEERLEQAFRWMASEGVDAVVNVGDLTELGTMEEVDIYQKIFKREFENGRCRDLKRPVTHFSVWGNHDCHDASYMRRDPKLWGITNKLEHIVGNKDLLNKRLCGVPYGDGAFVREIHGVWFAGVDWKSYSAASGAAAIDRVAKAAGPSNICFFVKHSPLPLPEEKAALARHPNCVRLSGHTHTPFTATNAFTVANGSLWSVSGSTSVCKGGGAQAAIVRVWGDRLTIDKREVRCGDRLGEETELRFVDGRFQTVD